MACLFAFAGAVRAAVTYEVSYISDVRPHASSLRVAGMI